MIKEREAIAQRCCHECVCLFEVCAGERACSARGKMPHAMRAARDYEAMLRAPCDTSRLLQRERRARRLMVTTYARARRRYVAAPYAPFIADDARRPRHRDTGANNK